MHSYTMIIGIALMPALLFSFPSHAGVAGTPSAETPPEREGVITSSLNGCDEEIKQHCSAPGQSAPEIVMCLMAYEEQLGSACRKSILETAMTIKAGAEAIDYSISACETDVDVYCRDVPPGDGRIVGCIKSNEARVSTKCVAALKQTGLWNQ